jgi:hypothetical protein
MRMLQQFGSKRARRSDDGQGGIRRSVGRSLWALLALVVVGSTSAAHAEVTIIAVELEGNVVFLGGGSLDIKAWTASNVSVDFSKIQPENPEIVVGPTPAVGSNLYVDPQNFEGPTDFGPGGQAFATKGSGDIFGFKGLQGRVLVVPTGYALGDLLEGSAIYEGSTFESLGMTPGSYTWSWGAGEIADSLTLNIGDDGGLECEEDLLACEDDLDLCDAALEVAEEVLDACEEVLDACEEIVEELGDLDKDGVLDLEDACPQTPLGMEVNADGCSREQLCESIETNMPKGVRWCMRARFGEFYDPGHPTCAERRVGWNRLCRAIRY